MKNKALKLAAVIAIIIGVGIIGLNFLASPDIPRADLIGKYTSAESQFMAWDNGDRVHYRDQGPKNGTTILLVHGSNASLHTWEAWVDTLRSDFRVVSVDLPGHGLTGAMQNTDYLTSDMSDFIISFCDRLGLQNIVYAGNSMGGGIGLSVALKTPELLKGLILISSAGMRRDPDEKSVGAFRLAQSSIGRQLLRHITPRSMVEDTIRQIVYDPEHFITPEKIDLYWEFMRMEGTREANIKRFAGYATQEPLEPRLGAIKTPTLILWGAHDTLIKPKYGERMHAILPASELIIYDNAGHLAMAEIPAQSVADSKRFIASLQ